MAGGYIIPETGDYRVQNQTAPVGIFRENTNQDNHSFDLYDYGLMPAEPPYVSRQQERLETITVPGLHGSLIQPAFQNRTDTRKNWETRTGSLDFYYVPDGKNHVSWDEYMMSLYETEVPGMNHDHPWCFFGQYHSMMHHIQGRRFRDFYMPGDSGGFEGPVVGYQYRNLNRAWLSKVKPDSSGRTTVTLSYEMLPSLPYGSPEDYE